MTSSTTRRGLEPLASLNPNPEPSCKPSCLPRQGLWPTAACCMSLALRVWFPAVAWLEAEKNRRRVLNTNPFFFHVLEWVTGQGFRCDQRRHQPSKRGQRVNGAASVTACMPKFTLTQGQQPLKTFGARRHASPGCHDPIAAGTGPQSFPLCPPPPCSALLLEPRSLVASGHCSRLLLRSLHAARPRPLLQPPGPA